MSNRRNKWKALRTLGGALFGRNNLIATDFEDISATRVDRTFEQDSAGVQIQFTVSNNALGKIMASQEIADALAELLDKTAEADE